MTKRPLSEMELIELSIDLSTYAVGSVISRTWTSCPHDPRIDLLGRFLVRGLDGTAREAVVAGLDASSRIERTVLGRAVPRRTLIDAGLVWPDLDPRKVRIVVG